MNYEALRKKVQNIIDGRNGKVDTNPQIDDILHLIAEDRERVEREARIGTLHHIPESWIFWHTIATFITEDGDTRQ